MTEDPTSSLSPRTPPATEEDRLIWLRLLRSRRVGPTTFHRLLADHGSAAAALEALPGIAAQAGVPDYRPCPAAVAGAELRAARRAGAVPLFHGAPDYPAALAGIVDAPPLLWTRGRTSLLARPMVALVGARSASSLGLRMARRLAADLGAAGIAVVSGLARGIDAAAHAAALETGTVAVLAGGIDVVYPPENLGLSDSIAREGLLLTEQPPGLEPRARHFPARNRIVSGLAGVVVVVEAAERSGSLITARTALDQGREVAAVPGHPMDGRAAGSNRLIRDGAALVRSAEDVLALLSPADTGPRQARLPLEQGAPAQAAMPPAPPPQRRPLLRDVAALHRRILDRLGPSPLAEDQLIRDLAAAPGEVTPALTELELDGRIARTPGGFLSRLG
ncbi:DNA-processing protein DprA [Histidinibacterium lentulum]|uniref:DNA-protecting protein DprA n=1 Tax=Histidinibacterium lentulum TaxID=2480588 RepID=A0A3N2QUV8_9RHOB|nr:DNA-processing protein DprA [Histidinibacterium lentulum]ROT98986.1 DNA-protecting protein DprA [Histidinibacterium lentulum]